MRQIFTNPILFRATLLLIAAAFAVIFGILLMYWIRKSVQEEARLPKDRPFAGDNAALAYPAIIAQLKSQEQELTRLRQVERDRAKASESLADAVLSNLPSGVLMFAPNGLAQSANPAARAILGCGTVAGRDARDLFRNVTAIRDETGASLAAPGALPEAVTDAIRQGRMTQRLEADYSTPAGEMRVLGIMVSPVRTNVGQTLGAACLIADLTGFQALERQARLRESMAALGEMSAGIAHEFKNSLATISGYAQMLKQESAPVQEFAASIERETANLSRVVSDFLNFARPQELRFTEVNLRELMEQAATDSGAVVDFSSCPNSLPFVGDATALRQAFSNLFRNSAEAAVEGRRTTVHVSAEQNGVALRILLRDDGRGISADVLPRIFVPFFSSKPNGTGLGLALVQRIVAEHKGAVSASSDGAGAAFTLSFPMENTAGNGLESR